MLACTRVLPRALPRFSVRTWAASKWFPLAAEVAAPVVRDCSSEDRMPVLWSIWFRALLICWPGLPAMKPAEAALMLSSSQSNF